MQSLAKFLLISSILANAYAEPTPTGGQATFYNSDGAGFTYYDVNGNALPAGTQIFLGLDGRGGSIVDENGRSTGAMAYATQELAGYWRDRSAQGAIDSANGIVVGPSVPFGSGVNTNYEESEYEQMVFELSTLLFGASEIGAKTCNPIGSSMPKSMDSWWKAVKEYVEGEKSRDSTLNERIAFLREKVDQIAAQGSSRELQIEAIQVQIESVDTSINSISGTNGRIPLREKLVLATLKSLESTAEENGKHLETYQKKLLEAGLKTSLKAAQEACKRTKTVNKCEMVGEVETCTETTEKDPVPGCEAAQSQIPLIGTGPANEYEDLYLFSQKPSKELNEKMGKLEDKMKEMNQAIVPSNDDRYNWNLPTEQAIIAMTLVRKDAGVACSNSVEQKNCEQTKLEMDAAKLAGTVKDPETIAEKSFGFLGALGVTGDASVAACEALAETWNVSDKIIGQSGQRKDYFEEVQSKVNSLLEIDRAKLQALLAQKIRLEQYLNNIKTALTNSAANDRTQGETTAGSATSQQSAGLTASGGAAGAGDGLSEENSGQIAGAATTSGTNAVATRVGLSSLRILSRQGPATSTGLDLSSSTGSSSRALQGLSLSGSSNAVATKIKANIKRVESKNSAYVASSYKKSSAYRPSLKNAAQSTYRNSVKGIFDKFEKTLASKSVYKKSAMGGISHEFSKSSGLEASLIPSTAATDANEGGAPSEPKKAAIAGTNGAKAATAAAAKAAGKNQAGKFVKKVVKSPSIDAMTVSQTIEAKKAQNPNTYAAKEEDSLFDRVTKAYIRNYEKIEERPE